jgi:hypothetical protein
MTDSHHTNFLDHAIEEESPADYEVLMDTVHLTFAAEYEKYGSTGLNHPTITAIAMDKAVIAALDAGFSRVGRTITTQEELDALPLGSIVLDIEYDQVFELASLDASPIHRWYRPGSEEFQEVGLPARVLHISREKL